MKEFINLLPLEYRRRAVLRRRLLQWSAVWMTCTALAVAVCWLEEEAYREACRAAEAAQRDYRPLKQLNQRRTTMQTELDQLRAKAIVFGQLQDERPLMTLMGVTSKNAQQCKQRLVVHELFFECNQQRTENDVKQANAVKGKPRKEAAETGQTWATVTFKGDALDNVSVARFVVGLRDSGLFRRVELKSSVGGSSEDKTVRSYLLNCDI